MILSVALVGTVFGCTKTVTTTTDNTTGAGTTAATTGGSTSSPTGTTGGTTGSVTAGATGGTTGSGLPTGEDIVCEGAAAPQTGVQGVPFQGVTVTPETPKSSGVTYDFSCTMCPNGALGIGGKYRYFKDDDVTLPDGTEYRETWQFFGNRFVNVIEGTDSGDNQWKTVVAEGYYFCPNPDELGSIQYKDFWNVVLVYTGADPVGAFGIEPGAVDLCFLGVETIGGADRIGLACNLFWDPAGTWQTTDEYCLLGSSFDGKECADPFE